MTGAGVPDAGAWEELAGRGFAGKVMARKGDGTGIT